MINKHAGRVNSCARTQALLVKGTESLVRRCGEIGITWTVHDPRFVRVLAQPDPREGCRVRMKVQTVHTDPNAVHRTASGHRDDPGRVLEAWCGVDVCVGSADHSCTRQRTPNGNGVPEVSHPRSVATDPISISGHSSSPRSTLVPHHIPRSRSPRADHGDTLTRGHVPSRSRPATSTPTPGETECA